MTNQNRMTDWQWGNESSCSATEDTADTETLNENEESMMFVRCIDTGKNPIVDPSWEIVADAIRRIGDPNNGFYPFCDTLVLRESIEVEFPCMTISGKLEGRCLVVVTFEAGCEEVLVEREMGKQTAFMVVGGQKIDLPACWVVSEMSVLQAAHTFFERGELDSHLKWETV